MKNKSTSILFTIITIFVSLTFLNSQIVEIEGGVRISNLPSSSTSQELVTHNSDNSLGTISTSSLFQRLDFGRNNNSTIVFTDANGTHHQLVLTSANSAHGGVNGINPNTHIAYFPVTGQDSYLLFNIDDTSGACTVLHVDDDTPRQGMYYASDNGNNNVNYQAWGNTNTHTFMIRFEGDSGYVLPANASYALICF